MPPGFFGASELAAVKAPPSLVPRCGECGLKNRCRSPLMPVYGEGRRGILVVGEAPGETEDAEGRPFVGASGRYLRKRLREVGLDLDRDCWTTNAVACRPWKYGKRNKQKDREPTSNEVAWCRPLVNRVLEQRRPTAVLLLGKQAVRSVLGPAWKENDVGAIGRWVGWKIPCQRPNAWVCPTWHPSYLLCSEGDRVLELMFGRHLEQLAACEGRPWPDGPPDWKRQVERIIDPEAAAEIIPRFALRPFAWDLETDRLKPDHPDARIVCCALSDGRRTVAYPWHGKAVERTLELLQGDAPKVGYNARFEHRWLLARYGVRVRNWVWDGMLAAHTLDNRPDITGLKFQAFVRLGAPDYDSHVKPYLKARTNGGNEPNRVGRVDLDSLLNYCALDALLEWHVAQHQMKEMGVEL